MPVRLLSYNVRYAGTDEGDRAWERRRDAVAAVIRRHDPDVVCLQEVWMAQLPDLADRLDGLAWVGDRVAGGEHTPVGYDPDRLSCHDHGVFGLSESPDAPSVPGWDATYPRVTTRATLARDGQRLVVYSTHFDHEGARARRESAALLGDRVTTHDAPVVVAGDLNCEPGSPPYERLTAGPLRDARTLADDCDGPEVTYTDFGAGPGRRLDHVLVAGASVRRVRTVAATDDEGRYPSDHHPVVADLVLG